MAKIQVKKGDTVKIIAGKDKGSTGKIIFVDTDKGRVIVEGCNMVTRHRKPRGANNPGGITTEAASIDASNVALICPFCKKTTKINHVETVVNGKKSFVRVCADAECGKIIDEKTKKTTAKTAKKAKKAETSEAAPKEVKPKRTRRVKADAEPVTEAPAAETKDSENE